MSCSALIFAVFYGIPPILPCFNPRAKVPKRVKSPQTRTENFDQNIEAENVIQLIYSSQAVTPFTNQQLTGLLRLSRENNHRLGISGMLVHYNSFFMQALEGEEEIVMSLYAKISKDSRHADVQTIAQSPIH